MSARRRKKIKAKAFKLVTGTHDILPRDQIWWQKVIKTAEEVASAFGFELIDIPILEETDLFIRSVGASTDIVEKQMYSLRTRGGDFVTLRPEGTAGVCRAYIEHGLHTLTQPLKLYYVGPMFRYESPQKGRLREFHQFGVEVIGEENAVIEAQIVQLFLDIFSTLGLKDVVCEVNSMGCKECRVLYKKLLSSYYRNKSKQVCASCRKRIRINVLRVLDCKEEKCLITRYNAPQILDHLCDSCRQHFKEFLEFLDELDFVYALNPHLVRGLDYYTRTVFEFLPREYSILSKSFPIEVPGQAALGGGGRYDLLIKLLGGKETPAVGGALGLERVINEMQKKTQLPEKEKPKLFLVQLGDLARRKSLKLFEEFRAGGVEISESLAKDSIKSQLKIADRLGVRYALILGQKEALENTIILREMESGKQELIPWDNLIKEIKAKLKA